MLLKAIDTLEFGLEILNYTSSMNEYLKKFKELKDKAQKEGKEHSLNIGGIELTVHASGVKFYAFRLSCNDFLICFMDKETKTNSPITVRFLSSYLWSFGVIQAYLNFLKWFNNFSVDVQSTKLSRVDPSLDADEISFKQKDAMGIVTRAKGKTQHFVDEIYTSGRTFSGFTVGRGNPILARIYNKTFEINNSGKLWFRDIWRNNGWDENKPVWRVEFQVRRQALIEFGIPTFDLFADKQDELWAYLTQEWLSLRKPCSDNISRWKLTTKWMKVQRAITNYSAEPLIRETIKQSNLIQLLDQASGLFMSVAALSNHDSPSDTSKLLESWCEIKLLKKDKSFDSEKKLRQSKFMNANEV